MNNYGYITDLHAYSGKEGVHHTTRGRESKG